MSKQNQQKQVHAVEEVTFDSVFDQIGHFGLCQIVFYLFLGAPMMLCATQNISPSFLTASMPHWCDVPRLDNFSFTQQREISVPYDEDYDSEEDVYDDQYASCELFDLPWDNYTDDELLAWDRKEQTGKG